jgi:hypothetical protein
MTNIVDCEGSVNSRKEEEEERERRRTVTEQLKVPDEVAVTHREKQHSRHRVKVASQGILMDGITSSIKESFSLSVHRLMELYNNY